MTRIRLVLYSRKKKKKNPCGLNFLNAEHWTREFHYVHIQSSQIIYTPKHSPLTEVCVPSASIKF